MAAKGDTTYYAELQADMDERLVRNRTDNRLRHKKKPNFSQTETNMLRMQERHRMNSFGDFPYPQRHFKVDSTQLSAGKTAERITEAFGFAVLKEPDS